MPMAGKCSHPESSGSAGQAGGGLVIPVSAPRCRKRVIRGKCLCSRYKTPIGFCTPRDSFVVVCSLLVCSMFTKFLAGTAEWIEFRQFFHKCRNLHPCRNAHAEHPVAAGLHGNSGDYLTCSTKTPMADSAGRIAPGRNGILIPLSDGECGKEPARNSGTLDGRAFLPAIRPTMTGGFRAAGEVSRSRSCRRRS